MASESGTGRGVEAYRRRHALALLMGTALVGCVSDIAIAQSTLPPVSVDPPTERRQAPIARPAPSARSSRAARPSRAARAAPAPRIRAARPLPVATPAPAPILGPSERGDGPVPGIVAGRTTSGSKTDTPLLETPQSVSVISAEQINLQKAQNLGEVVRYSAGVRGEPFGNDTRNDWFNVRGFYAEDRGYFLDNLQLTSSTAATFATWRVEPFGMERFEILRGPAAFLYGGSNPGGLINAISKKPLATPYNYVEFGVNNYGNTYGAFDFSGPAYWPGQKVGDGELLYRIVGLAGAGGTQTDHIANDRYYIAPSFTWKPNEGTSLTVLGSFSRQSTNGQNFLPYYGSVRSADYGFISTKRFTGDRTLDKFERTQAMLGYQFEHKFDDIFTFRQNLRYSYLNVDFHTVYGAGFQDSAGNLQRYNFATDPRVHLFNVDNNVEAKFDTGFLSHTMLFGLDYRHYNLADSSGFLSAQAFGGPTTPINLLTGYGFPNQALRPTRTQNFLQDQLGVYLQDQIRFDRFTLALSGRYDMVQTQTKDLQPPIVNTDSQEGRFSGRAGLIYNSEWGLAPFVSYSNAFNPLVGSNQTTGRPLKSETGEQYEVGVKYQPIGWNSYVAVTAYDLKRQNVPTTVFASTGISTRQSGEVASKGLEFEAVMNPMPGLNLIASYTVSDVEVKRDELRPDTIGRTPVRTPQNYGGVFADYTFQNGWLAGFGFGGGLRYVGKTYASDINDIRVPHYMVGDAVVHYERNGWRLAVNATNFTDERYVGGCSSAQACFYGERRKITGSISYKW